MFVANIVIQVRVVITMTMFNFFCLAKDELEDFDYK